MANDRKWLAIDQYGQREFFSIAAGASPRKRLMELCCRKSARKIYRDVFGKSVHVGWEIGGRWFDVYLLTELEVALGK
jgi:hypothetical protein